MFEEPASHGVARLVIGYRTLLSRLQYVRLLLHARNNSFDSRFEVLK